MVVSFQLKPKSKNSSITIIAMALFKIIKCEKEENNCAIIDYIGTVQEIPEGAKDYFQFSDRIKSRGLGLSRLLIILI